MLIDTTGRTEDAEFATETNT